MKIIETKNRSYLSWEIKNNLIAPYGNHSLNDILELICDTFEVDKIEAERDIMDFLNELKHANLIIQKNK